MYHVQYEGACADAGEAIGWGEDHMADGWGPCLQLKLGEDYYDGEWTDEEVDLARHKVFVDICIKELDGWRDIVTEETEQLRMLKPDSRLLTTPWDELFA